MNNQSTGAGTSTAEPQQPKSKPPVARIIVICIVLLLTIATAAVLIPWASYRVNNIVLREASVRGVVTKIGSRIEGRVKSTEVEPGQHVFKGQVLLRMEDSHLQASLDRARGELQSALRELDSDKLAIEQDRRRLTAEIERTKGQVKKAKGELEAQESSLAKLQKQFDRIESLVRTGAAAIAELDKVTGDRDKALAMVGAANGVLEAAQSFQERAVIELDGLKVRENRIGVSEAQIAIAHAKVASAAADLDATVIKAPEDGRVLEMIVNVGGSAKVGEPIIALWIGKAWIEAWVDERDLPRIQVQNPVDISFDSTPSRKITGRVESIGFVTDKQLQPASVPTTLHAFVRQNAMVPIRIALEDENPPVQLGLSVLVGIRKSAEKPEAISARRPKASPAWIPSIKSGVTTNAAITKL